MVTRPTQQFEREIDAFRSELLAHCYRMLGSVQDAEDLVQETMLRAWRARERYDDRRASLRTWLYRIATNACLNALDSRRRRPLPTGIGGPSSDPDAPLIPSLDVPWLQPMPDSRLDVAVLFEQRASLRLAFAAALQHLPPRQRAVLILRDVLQFSATEVAQQLGTTPSAVNSALQRARARLATVDVTLDLADGPTTSATVDMYVHAFENADVEAITRLLTDDAILEMPPVPLWFRGRSDYGRFIARVFAMRRTSWRMLQTAANGQPALAAYAQNADGEFRLHTVQLLTVTPTGVSRNTVYQDPAVFESFSLRNLLPGDT